MTFQIKTYTSCIIQTNRLTKGLKCAEIQIKKVKFPKHVKNLAEKVAYRTELKIKKAAKLAVKIKNSLDNSESN